MMMMIVMKYRLENQEEMWDEKLGMKRKLSHDSSKRHTDFSRIPSSSHDRHDVLFHSDMFHWNSLFEIFAFFSLWIENAKNDGEREEKVQ